jgi:hypothetical protein
MDHCRLFQNPYLLTNLISIVPTIILVDNVDISFQASLVT